MPRNPLLRFFLLVLILYVLALILTNCASPPDMPQDQIDWIIKEFPRKV